jgi:Fic family protein
MRWALARRTGRYELSKVGGEEVQAFVPFHLPPDAPPLDFSGELGERLRAADGALARLEIAGAMVPSLDWFLYAFVRKEAVLTSQIEGTRATLVDLLAAEAEAANGDIAESHPTEDLREVSNYLAALAFSMEQLADPGGLPLSVRLLTEAHGRLMRGAPEGQPGEVRNTQNWIGGTRPGNAAFVPPPPHALADTLSALEQYLHGDDDLPPLVRVGLVHAQFETIHPYLDGNGRIGRLLIALALDHWKLLGQPLLYLSLFFKRHRQEYYRRLRAVAVEGDWEGWLAFFLEGVETIADEAVASARELFALVSEDRARVLAQAGTSLTAARLFEQLPKHPIVSVAFVTRRLGITKPTAGRAVEALERASVLVETTGRKRERSWAYQSYLERLREGTDLTS